MEDEGIKTKKKIAEAFKNLMIEKSFEDIRVQDITDLCNLTRLTFYYHYQNKYGVLRKSGEDGQPDQEVDGKFGRLF